MAARKSIEDLKASLNKIIAIKEGIKVAEATSSKMCLTPQQRQCASSVYNEKILTATVKVKDITNKIDELEETIKSTRNNVRKPEFSSPEFCHPLNFLEDLRTYFENIPKEFQTVAEIIDCLEGDAKSWAILFKKRWSNIQDFAVDFLEQYWTKVERTLLKKEIVCGVWNSQNETLAQHFTSLVTQAKWLPRLIPDEELIFDIMCHFPENVQTAWQISKQSSILEATTFLQKLDEEMSSVLKGTTSSIAREPTSEKNTIESRNIHNGEHKVSKSENDELENQNAINVNTSVHNESMLVSNNALARLEIQLEKLTKHMSLSNKKRSTKKRKDLRERELRRIRRKGIVKGIADKVDCPYMPYRQGLQTPV